MCVKLDYFKWIYLITDHIFWKNFAGKILSVYLYMPENNRNLCNGPYSQYTSYYNSNYYFNDIHSLITYILQIKLFLKSIINYYTVITLL